MGPHHVALPWGPPTRREDNQEDSLVPTTVAAMNWVVSWVQCVGTVEHPWLTVTAHSFLRETEFISATQTAGVKPSNGVISEASTWKAPGGGLLTWQLSVQSNNVHSSSLADVWISPPAKFAIRNSWLASLPELSAKETSQSCHMVRCFFPWIFRSFSRSFCQKYQKSLTTDWRDTTEPSSYKGQEHCRSQA